MSKGELEHPGHATEFSSRSAVAADYTSSTHNRWNHATGIEANFHDRQPEKDIIAQQRRGMELICLQMSD